MEDDDRNAIEEAPAADTIAAEIPRLLKPDLAAASLAAASVASAARVAEAASAEAVRNRREEVEGRLREEIDRLAQVGRAVLGNRFGGLLRVIQALSHRRLSTAMSWERA